MKRLFLTLALVTAFVLAFTAVAAASLPDGALPAGTYRGFTPIRTPKQVEDGYHQGYITFEEARAEMRRNFGQDGLHEGAVGTDLQNTAHGGYVTATTKCAVCHSAHRASGYNPGARPGDAAATANGDVNLANVRNQAYLTAGATTCSACHVPGSAQVAGLLVEWGLPNGGPHATTSGRGCTMCHNAGIHGMDNSSFNVMNVFMLGKTRNRNSGGANWPTVGDPLNRDELIFAELGTDAESARIQRAQTLDVPLDKPGFTVADNPTEASTWWYDGVRALGRTGDIPDALRYADGANLGNTTNVFFHGASQYGAARSLATAYTCGEAGCHSTSAMFNLNWGMGFDRANKVGGSGSDIDGMRTITGHVMPSVRGVGGDNIGCGPCHAANHAGFPTASVDGDERNIERLAYGCDQCHDMVGVLTNSTAWPHGNRNIAVYEWLADGTQEENVVASGNLWMYGGNIARNNHPEVTPVHAPTDTIAGRRGPTSDNINFADQSWMVLTGVTSGRYGLPQTGSGLTDGACLKCHVPLDEGSREALGSIGADALRHAWVQSSDNRNDRPDPEPGELWGSNLWTNLGDGALDPQWNGHPVGGSQRLFLYR